MKIFKSYSPTPKIRRLRRLEIITLVLLLLTLLVDGKNGDKGLTILFDIPLSLRAISYVVSFYSLAFYIMSMFWKDKEITNNQLELSNDCIEIRGRKYSVDEIERITITYPEKVNKGKSSLYKNYLSFEFGKEKIHLPFALEKSELWKFFEFLRHRNKSKFIIVHP